MTRTTPSWFGQPRGLTILFLTEMWEKFSYYGMRALLVYYMTKALGFPGAKTSLVYGLYTSLIYFTPIIGGALSDRWLGRRRAILLGGSLMALGHFMMAFPALFYPALGAIAVGNGFYLPNLPSQIGALYDDNDPRKRSSYNIYYVGINLGSFLAPLVCGALGEIYGWHYGFASAGLGMCAGLAIYLYGSRWLPPESQRSAPPPTATPADGKSRLALFLATGFAVVLFRGAYEQMGNTIALWADASVDRHLGGLVIPASWFQALNPLLVFVVTPLLVGMWTRAASRGREVSSLRRMASGALGLAIAYLLLALIAFYARETHQATHWLWLAAFITLLTLAELHILPVGLGLFARLAPPHLAATTIAAWFLAAFAGNLLAGALGTLWSRIAHADYFALMAAFAVAAAVLLRLLEGPARRAERAGAGSLASSRA